MNGRYNVSLVNVRSYVQSSLCTETALFIFPFLSPLLQFVLSLTPLPLFIITDMAQHNISPPTLCLVIAVLQIHSVSHLLSRCRLLPVWDFAKNNIKKSHVSSSIIFSIFFLCLLVASWVWSFVCFALLFFFTSLSSFLIYLSIPIVPTVRHQQRFASLSSFHFTLSLNQPWPPHTHAHTRPLWLNQTELIPHHSNCGLLIQDQGPVVQVSQSWFTQKKPDHVAVQTHMGYKHDADLKDCTDSHSHFLSLSVGFQFSICENIWANVVNPQR